jgi:hypothetical protein
MVDRRLIARLDAARVSFCLIGDRALAVHGYVPSSADLELLTVDDTVLRPLFWEGHPKPVVALGDPSDHVTGRLRWDGTPAHELLVGRGHVMVFACNTARLHEELGYRVATPLGLVLVLLDLGGPGSRADIIELIRAHEARLDRPWRPPVRAHLEHLSPAARASWHHVELDLGAPT